MQLVYILTQVGRNSIRKTFKEGTFIKDNNEFDIAVNLKFNIKYVKNFLLKINSPWFQSNSIEEEEEEERTEDMQKETAKKPLAVKMMNNLK